MNLNPKWEVGLHLGLDLNDTKLQLRFLSCVKQLPILLQYDDGEVQFVFCMGCRIVNYYSKTKCLFLFLAVMAEADVERKDNAVRKMPILERTCKGIYNIIEYTLNTLQTH